MADLAPGAGGAAERALSEGGEIESLGELQPGSPDLGGSDGSEIVEIVHPGHQEEGLASGTLLRPSRDGHATAMHGVHGPSRSPKT